MSEYDAHSRANNRAYEDSYDRIFRQKKQERAERSKERANPLRLEDHSHLPSRRHPLGGPQGD